ncbi:MAG: efflux RND transporter periplasmic adaptor subunit [Cyclobacteriaceae bacterium]|nr:efflux RND transporter periplasmic adaptor subunit [Cyclobacteriaceae bacterium]
MKNISLLLIATLLVSACGKKSPEQNSATVDANVIILSPAQYKASHITLGKIVNRPVSRKIVVNGKLDVPPQSVAIIAAPMGGFVRSTDLLVGMKIRRGDVLATLENQEYIQLQQDYIDNRSKLEFLSVEYTRQQELAKENINAQKSLQQSKSQFESMSAMVNGLEAKLAMINVNASLVKSGKIKSTINLYSPIDGFVTAVNVNIGQFVMATDILFRVVNLDHMHAELQVYEKDINRVAIGQGVIFRLANDTTSYSASVTLVGKEISPERTVRVHCHLNKESKALLPGMFVTANIEALSVNSDVLPVSAIATYEGKDYIFLSSGSNEFRSIHVTTGNTVGAFTEILIDGKVPLDASIVTSGAFELMGLLKNKQE